MFDARFAADIRQSNQYSLIWPPGSVGWAESELPSRTRAIATRLTTQHLQRPLCTRWEQILLDGPPRDSGVPDQWREGPIEAGLFLANCLSEIGCVPRVAG